MSSNELLKNYKNFLVLYQKKLQLLKQLFQQLFKKSLKKSMSKQYEQCVLLADQNELIQENQDEITNIDLRDRKFGPSQ